MDDEDQLFDHSSSNHPAYPFDLVNADSPASTNSTVDASEVTIPKKKGRKGKVKELPFNWKDDLVYFLIDKWQEEELLYKVDDANYHDKMKRNLALVRIITQIEDNNYTPVPTVDQVLDKMNTLRSYYNTQRHKVITEPRVYKIQLFKDFYMHRDV